MALELRRRYKGNYNIHHTNILMIWFESDKKTIPDRTDSIVWFICRRRKLCGFILQPMKWLSLISRCWTVQCCRSKLNVNVFREMSKQRKRLDCALIGPFCAPICLWRRRHFVLFPPFFIVNIAIWLGHCLRRVQKQSPAFTQITSGTYNVALFLSNRGLCLYKRKLKCH